MDLTVTTESSTDSRSVLLCSGAIDIASRADLAAAVEPLIGPREVVLDLAGVSFMDSTGIGTLISLSQELQDENGRLIVENPSKPVARILEVAGLSDHWSA